MRAWRVHELGDPAGVLRLEDVPAPDPAPGTVLLRVEAAALNFSDVLLCRGEYQEKPPLPLTPGVEVAGTVAALGEGVGGVEVGTRVLATPLLTAGGLAERTLAAAADVHPVPEAMPWATAAALQVTYQTAHVGLHTRAGLQPGETLLVHAGAGGAGSAAVQLGLAAGARVIATAGGPEKVAVLRELGAHVAVDYRSEDFVQVVLDATDGRGADVVYDPVGGEVFVRSTKCVAFEGRILVIGFTSGRHPEVRTNHVLVKNYSVIGVHWPLYRRRRPEVVAAAHDALVRLWQGGRIDPLVSRVVPLAEVPAALGALAARATTGKVVVDVGR